MHRTRCGAAIVARGGVSTIAVGKLFANLSREAGRLAQVALRLDHALGDLAASDSNVAASLMTELQDIDGIVQALDALRQITGAAAAEVSATGDMHLRSQPLGSGVTLESVREACLNTGETAQTQCAKTPQIACSLFEEF
ncbi:hypothetical protein [Gymnodinialimonas sp. 57CJ19]|uniref:hypothetical protein n=1 Tax=Gymnodinialimonas sp. 57CJ19 TaxID=3138498 RepID=UPI0031342D9B